MNDLILFRPGKTAPRPATDGSGARILFFTGVRYQRMSEEAEATAAPPTREPREGGATSANKRGRRR